MTFNLKKIQDIGDLGIGIFLLILVVILQNRLLNYEIISMDVPSYLVASQDITLNNLPFENQWESKGPVFLYFYKFLMILSFKSLIPLNGSINSPKCLILRSIANELIVKSRLCWSSFSVAVHIFGFLESLL